MADHFEDIWKSIVRINSFAGLFTFKENEITNRKETFYKWFSCLSYIGINIILINTVYIDRSNLMNFIISSGVLAVSLIIGFSCFSLVRYQRSYLELIDWCRNVYLLDQYHALVSPEASSQCEKASKFCNRVINLIFVAFTTDALCITLGFAIVDQLLPYHIFGKYQPPIPFYLPFLEQNNWITFTITLIIQTSGLYILAECYTYLLAIIITISIHFTVYLDLINETIVQMKLNLARIEHAKGNLGSIDLRFEIKEWTTRICDMISEFTR